MNEVWTFLKEERGLKDTTLKAFDVTPTDDGGVRMPYNVGAKIRFHDGEKRSFKSEAGKILGLFGWHDTDADVAFLVEGETDTMRLWQELNDDGATATVLGLPGVETWTDSLAEQFARYAEVFVVLDNDSDYKVAGRVDNCWRQIRKALGGKARRIYLPEAVNDVCEFFDTYDLETLRMLADRRGEGIWHYKAMDLSAPATPPNWMVDKLLCHGDLTMMIGEPGVGKSWLSMGLAVAVAQQKVAFLGRNLSTENPRVLYVDEENPEGLVLWRLKRLGLTKDGEENIRYLHRQGVRLDRHPDRILDEALDFEPSLIVLDSLTRIHTKDENSAGEIASLFNDGINPLARETGALTLILHHVNKSESGSSFTRTRGSGDLSASIDSGLDVRSSDGGGGISVLHYKSRWISEGALIRAQIVDTPDGLVELAVNERAAF